jgi:hypothetical protein
MILVMTVAWSPGTILVLLVMNARRRVGSRHH